MHLTYLGCRTGPAHSTSQSSNMFCDCSPGAGRRARCTHTGAGCADVDTQEVGLQREELASWLGHPGVFSCWGLQSRVDAMVFPWWAYISQKKNRSLGDYCGPLAFTQTPQRYLVTEKKKHCILFSLKHFTSATVQILLHISIFILFLHFQSWNDYNCQGFWQWRIISSIIAAMQRYIIHAETHTHTIKLNRTENGVHLPREIQAYLYP